MTRVPLTILTIFHPEYFLGFDDITQLRQLPHFIRDRKKMEEARKQYAKRENIPVTTRRFHEREIANLGQSTDHLRDAWIEDVDEFARCFVELKTRLFLYQEQGSAAGWRFECRYNWDDDPKRLDANSVLTARDRIVKDKRLLIRQLWLNGKQRASDSETIPRETREYPLPKVISEYPRRANLVVGPFDPQRAIRRAELTISKAQGIWWIEY